MTNQTREEKRKKFIESIYSQGILESLEREWNEKEKFKHSSDVIDYFLTIDPSINKKLTQWIAKQYANKLFRLEDASRVQTALETFIEFGSKLKKKDINQYTWHELESMMSRIRNGESIDEDYNESVYTGVPNAIYKYEGPLGILVTPKSELAAKTLGRGTAWCTSGNNNNRFDQYNSRGDLNIWIDKTGEKYQFWFGNNGEGFQFCDAQDREVSHETFRFFQTQNPVTSRMFSEYEKSILGGIDLSKRQPKEKAIFLGVRNDVIQYSDLAKHFKVPGDVNHDNKWLSFEMDGKELLVCPTHVASGMSFDQLYQSGVVYGTDDFGPHTPPSVNQTLQSGLIEIKGKTYRCRLLKGLDTLPREEVSDSFFSWYNALKRRHQLSDDSEWGRLFYPLIINDEYVGYNPKGKYSKEELNMHTFNDGSVSWCQDKIKNVPLLVFRGFSGPSSLSRYSSSTVYYYFGWRACLERV